MRAPQSLTFFMRLGVNLWDQKHITPSYEHTCKCELVLESGKATLTELQVTMAPSSKLVILQMESL